jgi:hypothetical protein
MKNIYTSLKKGAPALLFLLVAVCFQSHAQVGLWRFNNNANDDSGNSLNATLNGSPSYTTDAREGSHALSLNGSTQYATIGNPSTLPSGTSARTISAWAKTTTISGAHWIMSYGTASTGQAMYIGQNGTSLVGGGFSDDISVTSYWATNTWHHICLTYDGTTARLYADGVEVANAAKTWNLALFRTNFGRGINNNQYWSGTIDDVRIYNTALTATQVQALATVPPTAPTGLSASMASSTSINLSWTDASTNETGFQIERSTTSGSGFSLINTTSANATSFNDTGLNPGTTYYYRIRSTNAGGSSAYTSESSATTSSSGPTAPTGLSATAVSSSGINLSWTDASGDETGFQVERSTTSGSGFTLITTTAANATSYSDASLTANTTYYYRIRATNGTGSSAYTAEASATTLVAPPSQPKFPTASAASSTSINVGWADNSSNETGFEIERSTTSGSGFVLIHTTAANVTTYSNTGLNEGTTYYYRIRAINAGGSSAYTVQAAATTSFTVPAAPTALTAQAESSTSVMLNWSDESSNETAFKIERSVTENQGFVEVGTAQANVTSHIDYGLTPSTKYVYRIRSSNPAGNSSYTATATVTTAPLPPTAPTGLVAAVASSTSVNISWVDKSDSEVEFEIERSLTSGSGFVLVGTAEANATLYLDNDLTPTTNYYYRVRASNGGGPSAYSNEVIITPPLEGGTQLCKNIFCAENGGVGIGTPIVPDGYIVAVKGKMMAEGVKVALQSDWPDYVFASDYKLPDFETLRAYIKQHGHLPNVPSQETVRKEGIDIEKINVVLLEKIEELSLYVIQVEERMRKLEEENQRLKENKK